MSVAQHEAHLVQTAPAVQGTSTRPQGLAEVREHLAPVLETIARRSGDQERERELPFEEVRLLADAGFGAVRLPVEAGGSGLDLREFTELLVDLGRADANQPQLWRNHVGFVEDRLWGAATTGGARDALWLSRVAAGQVVGGAWSERATGPGQQHRSTHVDLGPPATVSGRKFYSTGSIYADWVTVTATADDGSDVLVVVDAHAEGVELHDDWDGLGQRLTGSGTTVLDGVVVPPEGVLGRGDRSPHQEIAFQLVLVAALAGVAEAARDDVAAAVRARLRNYPQGLAIAPQDDAIVQEVVGHVAADAAAARAVVVAAASALDRGLVRLRADGDDGAAAEVPDGPYDAPGASVPVALREAAVATYEAQLVAARAALEAGTRLYDALGSSAVERSSRLDRHWRNARTLASHNPRGYKARLVGDWYLNGTDPAPWARRHPAG